MRDRDQAEGDAALLPAHIGGVAARLRDAAAALRRSAMAASALLDPVTALDTADTWYSPWQRCSTARLDGWRQALAAGATALTWRSAWYERTAAALEAAAAAVAAEVARAAAAPVGSGLVAGGEGSSTAGSVPSPVPILAAGPGRLDLPVMPGAWDEPPAPLVRTLGADLLVQTGSADPYATGLPGAGGIPGGRRVDDVTLGGDVGGDGPIWFDPDRLAALAGRLRDAATAAGRLAVEVGGTEEGAAGLLAAAVAEIAAAAGGGLGGAVGTAAVIRPAGTFRVAGLPAVTDVFRFGAQAVAAGAPELAGSIDRRMAHFAAAETVVHAGGVLIDQRAWFDDAPPPSLTQIRAVAGGLVSLIGTDPKAVSAGEVRDIGRRLAALAPATREAVISRLRGAPLTVLAGALTRLTSRMAARTRDELVALSAVPDLLLASAPTAMLDELVRLLPDLEPPRPGTGRGGADPGADGPAADRADAVIRDGVAPSDVGQGGVGDCYLAAALIGLARQRPALLAGGIHENANGTVTVTLHVDGRPFPVTVTRDLPGLAATDGGRRGVQAPSGLGAMAAYDLTGRPELWAAVYEKAYARAHGGYDAIDGGDPGVALSDLTGRPHHTFDPEHVAARDLAARLAAGDVVILSTGAEAPRAGTGLVAQHAYTVLSVDAAGGRVLLRNPWELPGRELTAWYRWDDLRRGLLAVSVAPVA